MRTILIALLCLLLGSCTSVPALYNAIDFAEMTPEEVETSPRIVKLRYKTQVEFSNERTPLPVYKEKSADAMGDWAVGSEYEVATIPAGTQVKVLALVFCEGNTSQPYIIGSDVRYLVELPDGRRGTASVPEVVEGMKVKVIATGEEMTIARVRVENVPAKDGRNAYKKYFYKMEENGQEYKIADLDCRNKRHFPVYLCGTIVFVDDEGIEAIPGMTLQQLEAHIAPPFNISRSEGKLVAYFPFINYTKGDDYYSHLEVTLAKQDTVFVAEDYKLANLQHLSEYSWLTRAVFNYTMFNYKTSIKKDAGQFAYYAFPRFSFWNSYYFNNTMRMILGIVVGLLLFIVCFLYILPKIARSIFYIRSLSNPQVKWLSVAVYVAVMIPTVLYFSLYDPISLVIVIFTFVFMYGLLYEQLELTRCEVCHSVDTIVQTDHIVLSEGKETDGVVHHGTKKVHVADRVTTRTYNTSVGTSKSFEVKREPIYRQRSYRFIQVFYHKNWKDCYKCKHCGQVIIYNRSKTASWEQEV